MAEGSWLPTTALMDNPPTSPSVSATRAAPGRGVVVAAFPAAAAAGAEILGAGGNAIDAACATAWALGVCEPAESGLGGQTTMLIRLADGRLTVIDGHSRAPASLSRQIVKRRDQKRGILATTIPSTPATLAAAQARYGRLSLAATLAPAIRLAEDGYRITRLQRRLLKWTRRHFKPGSPETEIFLQPDGGLPKPGDLLRQPLLAHTLARIAAAGVADFYEGDLAAQIVADMTRRGGLISANDLRTLNLPIEREPLAIEYNGHRVFSIPPPGGGTQVLLALRILEPLLRRGVASERDSDARWHTLVALATHAAFRERERWPDHPADMTPSLAQWLVSVERAERLVEQIRLESQPRAPVPDTLGESGNTTHLCAADADGNTVSLTQSIQSVFGAKTVHPTLGFVYNNYLSTCPRTPHPYRLGPDGLPQSNAAPTIVLAADGRPVLALGSAGSGCREASAA